MLNANPQQLLHQYLINDVSLAAATMSSAAAATPTTTYPFTYTTYTNTAPARFTKPSGIPTGIFSFGAAPSCTANSRTPAFTAQPSTYPIDRPTSDQAGCVISNAMEVSDHAFWDMYECCKGIDITAYGKPWPCTTECKVSGNQTWQELGECLSKRVEIVVCKPAKAEIGSQAPSASSSGAAASGSAQSTRAAASSSTGTAASGAASTGAASSLDVSHVTRSKAGVLVFALLAVGSAAGMFL